MAERTIRTIIEGQELLTSPASTAVSVAAQLMQRRRVGAIVEGGNLAGMVSARDAMGPELETFMYSVIVEEQSRDVLA